MSKDSHITRDDICIVCECSSTWSLATLGGKCKDVAAKLDVGRIDVVLYPNALLPPAVHGQVRSPRRNAYYWLTPQEVRTVALVEAWTAMTTLRSAGLVDHIGVSDFAVHELEILLRRFPEHPVEVQCIRDVSPFSPYDHMVRFCQGKQIDVVACFSVQLESLTHIQKVMWSKIASDITTAHQRMHFQHNLPSETIRVDNSNASINQTTETCDVQLDARRTASEVLATWLNQRGMIAVPMVEGDEPYDEGACRALFSLSHPFVKEPAAAAPSKPYHFVLRKDDMALLESSSHHHHEITLLSSTGYLENYLWLHFNAEKHATDKSLLLSIVALSNETDGRLWTSVDGSKYASFIDSLFRLKHGHAFASWSLREHARFLRFLTHGIRHLEHAHVAKTMLQYASLPTWKHLSDIQRNLVFADHPKLKRHWQNRIPSPPAPSSSSPVVKKRKVLPSSSPVVDLDGDFYVGLLNDLKAVLLRAAADPSDDDNDQDDIVHYVAHALDLWVDLMSQLPTRRFLRTLAVHLHLLMACRHSAVVTTHPLLSKQVALLHFYVHFPLDDQTGHAWSAVEHKANVASRAHALQLTAFATHESLRALSLLPLSSLSNRSVLQTQLNLVPDDILFPFAIAAGLVQPSDENIDLVDAFVDRFALHAPPTLSALPLFPTEADLWAPDTASLDDDHAHGDRKQPLILSTRKLNLQFLSLQDYLYRNYELFRLEAAHGVRLDLEHVLHVLQPGSSSHHQPSSSSSGRPVFRRRHPMAAPVDAVKIVRVDPPSIGHLHPAQVLAQVNVDLAPEAVEAWDAALQLPGHHVVFLVHVDASAIPYDDDQAKLSVLNAAERHGVQSVRGASVLQVLDGHGTAIGDLVEHPDGTLVRAKGKGTRRVLRVALDGAQYAKDVAEANTDVYTHLNVVVRRDAKVNNFKAVLDTIQDILREQSPSRVLPAWLADVFLGYGDPASAHHRHPSLQTSTSYSIPLFDTFANQAHAAASFPNARNVQFIANGEATSPAKEGGSGAALSFTLIQKHDQGDQNVVLQVDSTSSHTTDGRPSAAVQFTPTQVDAIVSGMHRGLTLVVGPPGTGKTDVAVQLIANLYQAYPTERVVIVTHANHALDDIFAKLKAKRVVDPGHLLRLGGGGGGVVSSDDETDFENDFTKAGRVAFLLARRRVLLDQVEYIAQAVGGAAAASGASHSCAQAAYFYTRHLGPALASPPTADFTKFVTQFTHASNGADQHAYFARLFDELATLSALEVLRTPKQRGDFLLVKHARVVAMTCTQAAMNRSRFIDMGFQYQSVVMEEAGQVSEIESLIPMLLQKTTSQLHRVVLFGDHEQLPPVVQNRPLADFSKLDQSLFTRLVRLGAPTVQLDRQGRTRPSIAALFKWKYKHLTDLTSVTSAPQFTTANAGFRHTFQFIDVPGGSETSPRLHAYENHLEGLYLVQVYQYMRLIGYAADRIAVLTTYAGQKALLWSLFQPGKAAFGLPNAIATVDEFQGQQSDFVLLSLVRTRHVGHLRDVRRAIVAVSRARLGLYVFGKKSVFTSAVELKNVVTPLTHATTLALVPAERADKGPIRRQECDKVPSDHVHLVPDAHHMSDMVAKLKAQQQRQ
ncbi:hypothetical protein DYB25_006198 [Aphanomyces astaci]|uniref:Helicase ATP-binding domain-containing protein n=1 Tax=Aphanomyces astaci TaxID=112090 RepID=A0A397CMV7_APHAT|nr:hypothetical protein DYB25_006198 [Aphanomyces astaci]RHY46664.1 hypothetical protein DYB38_006724 [Aphanomyces astaci]RHY77333.1 hypothetical protein DYB30_007477 [Aphanomyces astaci]RHZ25592.1 hypothetical protein DYB31_004889 [Aphanomyces astaci]